MVDKTQKLAQDVLAALKNDRVLSKKPQDPDDEWVVYEQHVSGLPDIDDPFFGSAGWTAHPVRVSINNRELSPWVTRMTWDTEMTYFLIEIMDGPTKGSNGYMMPIAFIKSIWDSSRDHILRFSPRASDSPVYATHVVMVNMDAGQTERGMPCYHLWFKRVDANVVLL